VAKKSKLPVKKIAIISGITIIPIIIIAIGLPTITILPQENPDLFEIPFVDAEDMQNNQEIIEEVTDIFSDPEIIIDPVLVQAVNDCQALIFSASQPNSAEGVTNQTVAECTSLEQQLQQQIQQETQKTVNNLEEEIVVPEAVTTPTESSTSDPFEQLCDQNPSLIICGDTTSLELITRVLKTDSSGIQTTTETTRAIPQLAFFVEDVSNIDFRNGLLQFELIVKGDPDFTYNGNGEVDLFIGQGSLFTDSIPVIVNGKADQDGKITLQFVSPTGVNSNLLLFKFADNFNRFPDGQTTPIRLHINQLDILGERQQSFSLTDVDVFSMDIARDETKILITDSQGIISRVYPSDSRIILSTVAGTSSPYVSYTYRIITYDSIFYGNGQGCSLFNVISDVSYPKPAGGTTYPVPAPTISGISVLGSNSNVITSSTGGSGKVLDYAQLTRDQNYKLKVTSPSITSSDLVYGKSQETKSYTCQQSATPNLTTVTTTSGNTSNCGYYTVSYTFVINSANPLTLGSISCNIP